MKKVIINSKKVVDIFEDYKGLLKRYGRIAEESINQAKGENLHLIFDEPGYMGIAINYFSSLNEGEITTYKHYNGIEYITRTNFIYLNNKVFLGGTPK